MARIKICNMVATHRRSISDLFLENGIWILKQHLQEKGHTVEPLDLATHSFYRKINPFLLSRFCRSLFACKLYFETHKKSQKGCRFLASIAMRLQGWNTFVRRHKMSRELSKIADGVAERNDKIFGIKVWYGESFTWSDELSKMIHLISPSTITIAGGYHPSLYDKDFMSLSSFDLAVTGEGEYPLEQILAIIDNYQDHWDREAVLNVIRHRIKSGALKNTLIQDKDRPGTYLHRRVHPYILEKSIPRFKLKGDDKMRVHILVDSLGCAWGKCNFCVHSAFFKKMAPRDPSRVVDEIQEITRQGIGLFRFSGSDTYPGFGSLIAQQILERRLKIHYTIGARATKNACDPVIYKRIKRQYELMIHSGMRAVFMGGETGNDWVNEHVMNKGITSEDIRWTIRALREAEKKAGVRIYISLAYIYPTPTLGKLTLDEIFKDNLQLVRDTQPDSVMVSPPSPFKQSAWYKKRNHFGFDLDANFVQELIAYEYILYKPAELWQDIGITLDGMNFKTIMKECGRMRKAIESEGIETDVSDEHFMMQIATGYTQRRKEFKRQSLLDIISGDYRWTEDVGHKLNQYSQQLAEQSNTHFKSV